MNAVLRFPTQMSQGRRPAPSPAVPKVPRLYSDMQALDTEGARLLLDVTKDIIQKADSYIAYVDHNRMEARSAGVETIAIELSSILEGGRLVAVQDALEDAAKTGNRLMISLDGFAKLRRAEMLISEADQAVARFVETPSTPPVWLGYPNPAPTQSLSGTVAQTSSLEGIPISLLLLGVIGAGAVFAVVIMALTKK